MEANPDTWGYYMPRRYNDWVEVGRLTSLPTADDPEPSGDGIILPNWAAHRDVDMAILHAFRDHPTVVRTAIVCPPTVYGPSRFPIFTRSIQLPRLLQIVLRRRRAFTINKNANRWNMIHTQDLSALYLLLTEAAVDGLSGNLWNEHGYYFAENGGFAWGEIIHEIARVGYAKGLLDSDIPEELSNAEVSRFWKGGQMNVSSTSLGEAQRARELLGWNPEKHSLLEDIGRTMEAEAAAMGLLTKIPDNQGSD
ncbi:hypothetical protein EIK77_000220 [Talaromyces pinophilus]|nr:hypothetical protein EIK77_000220 [Talaromyces pinophilus]